MAIRETYKRDGLRGIVILTEDYHADYDILGVLRTLTDKRWFWNEIGFSEKRGYYVIYLSPGPASVFDLREIHKEYKA